MTPDVTLLRMDQMANKAIPITAKMEENTTEMSVVSNPRINDSIKSTRAMSVNVT